MDVQTIQKFFNNKNSEHILCGYSMSTNWAFDDIKNNHTLYCGKDCMKNFCESLREQVKIIIHFEKKKLSLTKEDAKVCIFVGKIL